MSTITVSLDGSTFMVTVAVVSPTWRITQLGSTSAQLGTILQPT